MSRNLISPVFVPLSIDGITQDARKIFPMTIGPRACTRLSCNIKVSLRGRGDARAMADSLRSGRRGGRDREVGSRCRNDMSGYLSGHAILSSGVRGRKGSYRKGGKKRRRA